MSGRARILANDAQVGGRRKRLATACGFGAILLWSTLASLTVMKGSAMPPFQTTAITFFSGGLLLVTIALARGRAAALKPNVRAFALGLYGLFLFHVLYFGALKLAPPAAASLIASLWSLMTVLFSALLPGHRLRLRHVIGGLMGLGATLLVAGGDGFDQLDARQLTGLASALGCAFVWASYSVLSRLVADTPSESVALPCLATAALAFIGHVIFEPWTWEVAPHSWIALLLLGVGPVGSAFVLWDIGMKHGNIALLGVLAYAAPIISTMLLVTCGFAKPSASLAIACVLVVAAAALSAGVRETSDGN
jgi:drug/metabolite transporter (DMT)-like permease